MPPDIEKIIEALRQSLDANVQKLVGLTDIEARDILFANHRGARGMRLTPLGLILMQSVFDSCDAEMRHGKFLTARHLLYLDRNAVLPYYCTSTRIVVFDLRFGVKLRLTDGDLDTVIELCGGDAYSP